MKGFSRQGSNAETCHNGSGPVAAGLFVFSFSHPHPTCDCSTSADACPPPSYAFAPNWPVNVMSHDREGKQGQRGYHLTSWCCQCMDPDTLALTILTRLDLTFNSANVCNACAGTSEFRESDKPVICPRSNAAGQVKWANNADQNQGTILMVGVHL